MAKKGIFKVLQYGSGTSRELLSSELVLGISEDSGRKYCHVTVRGNRKGDPNNTLCVMEPFDDICDKLGIDNPYPNEPEKTESKGP